MFFGNRQLSCLKFTLCELDELVAVAYSDCGTVNVIEVLCCGVFAADTAASC